MFSRSTVFSRIYSLECASSRLSSLRCFNWRDLVSPPSWLTVPFGPMLSHRAVFLRLVALIHLNLYHECVM